MGRVVLDLWRPGAKHGRGGSRHDRGRHRPTAGEIPATVHRLRLHVLAECCASDARRRPERRGGGAPPPPPPPPPPPSHNTPETEAFIGKYKDCKKESKGSSLKLLMVAEGAAHVYPRLAPTSEWDTCAAHAIVECAGGEVLQHAGGKDCNPGASVEYNKPHPLNPFFVVYGKREVRKAVKKKDAISSAGGGPSPLVLGGVLAVAVVGYLFLA
mmetsp:Transcript_6159/g.18975  ORF Transcript_6159/g.18975 Transcript_6159/m.18975 type:complete len:213 (-) Transcript_6159:45-683(-)